MENRVNEEKIISQLEEVGRAKFSDEQLEILKHNGGMSILACAGSGKTSSLINLIAKRIKTGEIKYVSKLLCTTYSKGGADELGDRLNKLLPKIGIREKVQVKTLHALYLQILKQFGVSCEIISAGDRARFIRESVKEVGLNLDQDDLQTLDSLLSFQINNILDDKKLVNSYVYTLENVSLDEYKEIREGYNRRKDAAGLIDFDDLQLRMYVYLVKKSHPDMLAYIHSHWTDFYIDEAQDISKIQFEILRKMVSDPNKLVFIGDDDQCLVGDTKIKTLRGNLLISEIIEGDKILTGVGNGNAEYQEVEKVFEKEFIGKIAVITTKGGMEIKGTPEHLGFVEVESENVPFDANVCNIVHTLFKGEKGLFSSVNKSELKVYTSPEIYSKVVNKYMSTRVVEESVEGYFYTSTRYNTTDVVFQEKIIKEIVQECKRLGIEVRVSTTLKLNGKLYAPISLGEMERGMIIPVTKGREVKREEVWSVEFADYNGKVFDVSVPSTRNFSANGILVHNCIYQWRGADPSIILNIDAYYDIEKFTLSTNYRCKGNIVRPAAQGIKNNSSRYPKNMEPFLDGGSVRIVDTKGGDLFNQSKYAFAYIMDLINNKGVRPKDIAVLSRNNIHLSILNNMLFREGVFSETSPEMRFTGSYIYSDIKGAILLSEDSCDPHLTKKMLWKMCRYMGARGSRYIGDFQEGTGMILSDAIGYVLWRMGKIKVDNPRYANINSAVRVRAESFGKSLKSDTLIDLELIYRFLIQKDRGEALIGIVSMYLEGTAFMYKSEDKRRAVEGMVAYTIGLLRTVGPERIESFFRASEQVEKGLMDTGGDKVTMSTMHGSKGKEWPYVILFSDDNVAFPSFDGIKVMLNKGIEMSDISNSIDENRRLHYVAMTRAKENLTVFTDSENPSIYLLEAFGLFMPEKGKSNGLIIGMADAGGLVKVLVDRGKQYLFNREHPYLLEIDVSKVMTEEENENVPEEVVEFSLGVDEDCMGEYY